MPVKTYYVIVSTKEGADYYYAKDKFFTTDFSRAFLMDERWYANILMKYVQKTMSTTPLRLQEVVITLKDVK